jgi:membrane fusion protein, peptide pheromone/bacteriocin exporter
MLPSNIPYLPQYPKTNLIYIACLLVCVGAITALPFLSTQISVQSTAIIRPATEINVVRSSVTGRVKFINMNENQGVHRDEVLLTISNETNDEKIIILEAKLNELSSFVSDLETLVSSQHPANRLRTSLYKQAWLNYHQQLQQILNRHKKVKLEYDRNSTLHSQKVIPDAEFENHQFEFENSKSELESLKQNQLAQWQLDLHHHEEELNEIRSQLSLVNKEKENLTIKAPVSGNIQNVAGLL